MSLENSYRSDRDNEGQSILDEMDFSLNQSLAKIRNGTARITFLLKRLEKDIAELNEWGITVNAECEGNENWGAKF